MTMEKSRAVNCLVCSADVIVRFKRDVTQVDTFFVAVQSVLSPFPHTFTYLDKDKLSAAADP